MSELNLKLWPSRQLAIFLVAGHGLAGLSVWFSALPAWACLLMDLLLLGALYFNLRRHWRAGIRQLRFDGEGWWLADRSGEQPLDLRGERLVTSWLIVLNFITAAGRRIALVLPPDSASADDLRRLRVALRFG